MKNSFRAKFGNSLKNWKVKLQEYEKIIYTNTKYKANCKT